MLVAAAFAGLVACGEHPLYQVGAAVEIRMQADSVLLTAIGRVHQLSAIARDAQGRVVEPPLLHWVSNDPTTVQVDQSGTVTAVRDGAADVTVLVGTVSKATSKVRVRAGVVQSARVTAVINGVVNTASTRDSVRMVIYDPRTARAANTP